MDRPRTPLSSYGTISTVEVAPGKWRARTRYRFESGKLRQVKRFASSRAKAEAALRRALTEIQESTATDVRIETRLRDLGERFLASKASRAPRTVETYQRSVRRVIVPRLGDLSVGEVTPDRLQRFLDAVAAEHGTGTAKTARAVLSGTLGLATRADAMRHNLCGNSRRWSADRRALSRSRSMNSPSCSPPSARTAACGNSTSSTWSTSSPGPVCGSARRAHSRGRTSSCPRGRSQSGRMLSERRARA